MNKVLITVPTADQARQAHFYDYFNLIRKPEGTAISFIHGQSPARNRNLAIQQAIDHECTHILFIDDDTAPPPDILEKLIAHDKDIVGGLALMRSFPHQPILFDFADSEGRCKHHFLEDGEAGLVECVALGLGCALIKTDVFKNLEKPWVRLGELEKDHWCDDIGLYRRVRQKGYKIYCDLTVLVGHMQQVIVWPIYQNGKWYTSYDTRGTQQVLIPACKGALVEA